MIVTQTIPAATAPASEPTAPLLRCIQETTDFERVGDFSFQKKKAKRGVRCSRKRWGLWDLSRSHFFSGSGHLKTGGVEVAVERSGGNGPQAGNDGLSIE